MALHHDSHRLVLFRLRWRTYVAISTGAVVIAISRYGEGLFVGRKSMLLIVLCCGSKLRYAGRCCLGALRHLYFVYYIPEGE